jgi:hypothetical protein
VQSRCAVRFIDLSMAGRKVALVEQAPFHVHRGRVREGNLDGARSPNRRATTRTH